MQATKNEENMIYKERGKGGNMNLTERRTNIKGQKEKNEKMNWP